MKESPVVDGRKLWRDSAGRVFFNVSLDALKKISKNLYMVNISDNVPLLPIIEKSKKEMFEIYINFFKLRASVDPQAMVIRRLSIQGDGNQRSVDDRRALIYGMKRKLDDMEEKLTRDDSLVACCQ